jgi:hypothetical protein
MDSPPSESGELAPEDTDLDRLRAAVRGTDRGPGLAAVLPRLQRAHRKSLVRQEHWTQGDLARHPEPRELIRSVRRPGNRDEQGRLVHVFDSRRMLVEDVHENRVVRYVALEVRSRLRDLAARGEGDAAEILHDLDAALAGAPFLREVSALDARPTVPTATLSGDPLYRTVFRTWLQLER